MLVLKNVGPGHDSGVFRVLEGNDFPWVCPKRRLLGQFQRVFSNLHLRRNDTFFLRVPVEKLWTSRRDWSVGWWMGSPRHVTLTRGGLQCRTVHLPRVQLPAGLQSLETWSLSPENSRGIPAYRAPEYPLKVLRAFLGQRNAECMPFSHQGSISDSSAQESMKNQRLELGGDRVSVMCGPGCGVPSAQEPEGKFLQTHNIFLKNSQNDLKNFLDGFEAFSLKNSKNSTNLENLLEEFAGKFGTKKSGGKERDWVGANDVFSRLILLSPSSCVISTWVFAPSVCIRPSIGFSLPTLCSRSPRKPKKNASLAGVPRLFAAALSPNIYITVLHLPFRPVQPSPSPRTSNPTGFTHSAQREAEAFDQ